MKTLNLVDLDTSDIKYQHQKFPDGQNNLVINPYSVAEIKTITETNELSIQIKSRLNNWLDLELIVCAVASLRELGAEEIHLFAPYIIGARSDRKFEQGGNNYLKDVICPVINSLNFKTVTCIDPHSDVLEACINNFKKISNYKLVNFALQELFGEGKDKLYNPKKFILISPDAGANKKIFKIADYIKYEGEIITCSKDRDKDGNLTKTVVPLNDAEYQGVEFVIIDDICDGGATFTNIAKELKNELANAKIYLIVTHGIFSKGFGELQQYFDGIYTTNSYKQLNPDTQDFIKQLNVF